MTLRTRLRPLFLALGLAAAPLAAFGEEVVAGLSQNQVAITANFDGSDILIFGAVKREAPLPAGEPLQVIVAVSGPQVPVTVRRKTRQLGIWVNTDSVEVDSAPSFYAVATSGPIAEILTNTQDLRYRVTTPRAIRSVGAPDTISDSENFTEALIRIRSEAGLYQLLEGTVDVTDQTLFSTSISLPANLTEGEYTARIFLTRDGEVVDEFDTALDVRKVGLERILYTLAHEQSLLYGLLSLAIAIAAGWGASAVFSLLRK
ncbi:TIGR02186 family protein [Pseudoruegeria sp. SHC-113]|uniref:TIGR02186 family protein n=1 Tax=Pseudoruegeria sp. SHC-113 TaxID=2855439 RepID=UPI0021BA55F2|nr:TIGR02186 family protein [Pseudoruegeria sp. SHC-113]MCT8161245.1 TIGR02186 family protein [Pseudoruegeria sp. SHC-113]